MTEDTIVAISTPIGYGGIGVVRVSGPLALSIATGMTNLTPQVKKVHVCRFFSSQEVIDSGILLYFKSPQSFTGEDCVEFQCHGSPVILDLMIKRCVELGARLAQPGEFSLRAFLNKKIDLVQAEAVADLIHATSETAAKMAMRSLQGDFSKHIQMLHDQFVQIRVLVEAMIDFPEEEVDFLSTYQVKEKLTTLWDTIEHLMSTAKQGSLVREGVTVVIAGPPNAGKSTLMNALSGREVAIVTDLPGTTRDIMREGVLIDGIPLLLVDTAGIRPTECLIEQEGIKRAQEMIKQADILLWVVDVNLPIPCQETNAEIPTLMVYNKADICQKKNQVTTQIALLISAKTGEGLPELKQAILQQVGYRPCEGVFLARRRHLVALGQAKKSLQQARAFVDTHLSLELVAEELRIAHYALSAITGEYSSDDLLGDIFSTFCIGK